MWPLLDTAPPTRLTEPPGPATIVPLLTTEPGELNACRRNCPVASSYETTLSEVASSDPTFTCEPGPNMMPWELNRTTRPLASMRPNTSLGFRSRMRFSATEFEVGWLNRTDSFAATSNDCQSIDRRLLA